MLQVTTQLPCLCQPMQGHCRSGPPLLKQLSPCASMPRLCAALQAYNADTMSFELPETDMVRAVLSLCAGSADACFIVRLFVLIDAGPCAQVYIVGIPPGTSEEELAAHFGSIGDAPSRR